MRILEASLQPAGTCCTAGNWTAQRYSRSSACFRKAARVEAACPAFVAVFGLVGTSTVTGVCEPLFQPLDEQPTMEVTVATDSVGTTAGTSGLSRERALRQPEVPAEPLPRSPPAAQPTAGPSAVRTMVLFPGYQPCIQRRSRGPHRVSHREALAQRLANDYARSVVQTNEGVDRLAAATERVVAAVERQADQVAEALRPVGQLSQLLAQLMQEAVNAKRLTARRVNFTTGI
nr:uncharacterized protein LOC129380398 isoform X3 [Dermacentor andersoni]